MKLTDNMIFLLAGLPRESYQVVQKIYQKYEAQGAGSIKTSKPDCKGCNFRELRNLDVPMVHTLLVKVRKKYCVKIIAKMIRMWHVHMSVKCRYSN